MSKKTVLIAIVVVSLFALGISVVSAQRGRGNGRGGRNGNANTPPVDPPCCEEPLQNQDGSLWQQRNGRRFQSQQGEHYLYGFGDFMAEGELTDEAYDIIVTGLQDEYNAYTLYGSIIDQFGPVNPFVNIQWAESQHIAALENVLVAYEITVPKITVGEMPVFDTVADACQAAADAEVANFGLYDEMIDGLVDYPQIQNIVIALRDASEFKHLPAFENCAAQ